MDVRFNFANQKIVSEFAMVDSYYYAPYKNKNIKIRCRDTVCVPGMPMSIVQNNFYALLKATERLSNCLFVYDIKYSVKENDKTVDKTQSFYFMIVTDKEFEAYKVVSPKKDNNLTKDGEIKRPKKVK